MSQEQPPVRSRRELRKARDEALGKNQDAGTSAAGEVGPASKQPANTGKADAPRTGEASRPGSSSSPGNAAGRVRRVAPGPVDTVPFGSAAERSSQIRARDRAALRTIKQLAEKEEQLSGGGPPTRRQLRLMQLKEQAVTSAMAVVPPAADGPNAAPAQPGAEPKKAPASAGNPVQQPDDAPTSAGGRAPADEAGTTVGGTGGELPHGMTVEQALEARALIAEQAKNQLAKMEHIAATDPEAVDPEILAEQIALAERAAVLNKRAMAKQKLAEQNTPAQPSHNGPSTASNLAMVTPLEFVQVPGVDRPVMKRPATSYVPLVTSPGPRMPARGKRPSKAARSAGTAPSTGRSRVIARAEAAARAAAGTQAVPHGNVPWDAEATEDVTALPPVAAKSAYGLDPLDASTAGLGRAHRLRLLQVGVLALGVIALIAGVIMIISGLSR
ncbi:hypothetical protein ASG92_15720 [Arthrobacter sp. Soil736]|uniref:hypothetical protein n=1 Tax=Arthrobacter sp. Soil736 TaxID=1736395 RepID=UPI0007010299|nr:hypothetical protein [Arthrobacter sp. Soil736]KRE66753.1 hypothetical protein ASG92_15720 [Arthrobacter sp. Soil736]